VYVDKHIYVNGGIQSDSIYTSNLGVYAQMVVAQDIVVGGDARINGIMYAAQVRLGSPSTPVIIDGLLTASLSPQTQSNISHLGKVTIDELRAPIAILGIPTNTTQVRGDLTVDGSLTATLSSSTMNSIITTVANGPVNTRTSNVTCVGSNTSISGDMSISGSLTIGGYKFAPSGNSLKMYSPTGELLYEFSE
jgi:cytoskeletal protein CcmA (bactofilin family)